MQDNSANKRKLFQEAMGRVIQKLRKEANLSSRAVAYSIELSKTTILLAQKGELDPQMTTFCKIAEAFNLKPSEFLSLIEKELPPNWVLSE